MRYSIIAAFLFVCFFLVSCSEEKSKREWKGRSCNLLTERRPQTKHISETIFSPQKKREMKEQKLG